MKFQIGHSRDYDYENELYNPLKQSPIFSKHEFILPHDNNSSGVNSKETLKTVDIFFAEVSYPTIGLGIELGFAHLYDTPIVCFAKKGKTISGSLKYVCNDFFEYSSTDEFLKEIQLRINKLNK